MSLIGRSVKRLEDRPLLSGSGRFAADVTVPDMLYMRVVRSPIAFGRLTGLWIAEALAHPDTVAVWTAEDVADIPPIDFRMTTVPGLVRRFIDPEAEFLFAPTERVFAVAAETGATLTTPPVPSRSRMMANCAASTPSSRSTASRIRRWTRWH